MFQDYVFFPFTVGENLLMSKNKDYLSKDIKSVLNIIGASDVIENLPLKEQTNLFRIFDDDGYIPSGGELQKLALARTIIKGRALLFWMNQWHQWMLKASLNSMILLIKHLNIELAYI